MGTSLTGTKIRDTYDALIKVSDNGALDGTLQVLTDGLGNNSALSLSTAGASVGGSLAVSGALTASSATMGISNVQNWVTIPTFARFGHSSYNTGTDYGYLQDSSGVVYIEGTTVNLSTTSGSDTIIGGNVGVGVTPAAKLHTYGAFVSDTTSQVRIQDGTGVALNFGGYSNGAKWINVADVATPSSGYPLAFQTGGTERMRIHSGGDVSFRDSSANEAFYWDASAASLGIGTPSPNGKLTLSYSSSSADGLVFINSAASGRQWRIGDGSGAAAGYFGFYDATAAATRMVIDSSGNVGIGVSPSQSLDTAGKIRVRDGGSSAVPAIQMADGGVSGFSNPSSNDIAIITNNTERMRITSGGQVAINSGGAGNAVFYVVGVSGTNDVAYFKTSGAAGNYSFQNSSGTLVGYIQTDSTSTTYATSSDYRLKEDWVAMEGALDRVDALNPINFAWKSTGKRVDGFLAHELAEVVPEAVTGEKDATEIRSVEVSPAVYEDVIHPAEEAILDEEGNVIQEAKEEWVERVLVSEAVFEDQELPVYQGIDQSKIVPLLVAAIQELRAELNALKQA